MTEEELRKEIESLVLQRYNSQRAAARALGVSYTLMNRTLSGEIPPGPKLLKKLGFERATSYRRVEHE